MEDLTGVDPKGRLDVLAFRGLGLVAEHLEKQIGANGLWNSLKPVAQGFVQANVPNTEIPPEAQLLLIFAQHLFEISL